MEKENSYSYSSPQDIFQRSIMRAVITLSYSEIVLNKALSDHGPGQGIKLPSTAYLLPDIRTSQGEEITRLEQLVTVLNEMRARVKEGQVTYDMARQADESTAYASEIIETVSLLRQEKEGVEPWSGFLEDL